MFSVVLGTTVLFTTTKWYVSFLFRASPISIAEFFMCRRSMLPFGWLGVATVMNVISVFKTASSRFSTHLRYPLFVAFSSVCCRPGSWKGGVPLFIDFAFLRLCVDAMVL